MNKFLSVLLAIDKDANVALQVVQKAKPILSLTPIGAEVSAVADAILALEAKLGLPTA